MKKIRSIIDSVRNLIIPSEYKERTYRLERRLEDGDYPWVVEEGWRLIESSRDVYGKYNNPIAERVSGILDIVVERELGYSKKK